MKSRTKNIPGGRKKPNICFILICSSMAEFNLYYPLGANIINIYGRKFTDLNLQQFIDICEFSHKIFLHKTIESHKLRQKVSS
jgi:hypothetical protein